MEGKGGYYILIAVVAFLSLTLALLAGYVFLGGDHSDSGDKKPETVAEEKRPKDEELSYFDIFEAKTFFNLKSNEPEKISAIQLSAKLVYFQKVEGIKSPTEKVTFYKSNIKELIGTYFENMTSDQLKTPGMKQKSKEELVKRINHLLLENEKTSEKIIYDIVFDEWFVQ